MLEDRRTVRLDRPVCWAAAGVFALAVLVYAPSMRNGFVDWDDRLYVNDNPILALGLSAAAVRRAFEPHDGNWIPATWLSLAVDHALFGDEPAGYHAVNALLHATTAVLLLFAWAGATAALAPAVLVALSFALHPLRVESVAWVAERKDVLSGLFFAATLMAWLAYARRPGSGRYLAALAAAAASLLSKPTAVTLPFVLLLLDGWPLARLGDSAARRRALLEKLPFLALAAFVAHATWNAQRDGGAFEALGRVSLEVRAGNALMSYLWYFEKAFWPANLAAFYPHTRVMPDGDQLGFALFVGIALTIAALALRRQRPWLLVGWAWLVVVLIPMIGLVQVGQQARADRYAYLPLLGLEIALAFEAWHWLGRRPAGRAVFAAATLAAALALTVATRVQLSYWRDTDSLFSRALAVTERNFLAHERVGRARLAAGDLDAAVRHLSEALRIEPRWPESRDGLAQALWQQGRRDEAIWNHREAVRLDAGDGLLRLRLVRALSELGWHDEAINELRVGVRLARAPHGPRLRAFLAEELALRGELEKAREEAVRALAVDASLGNAHWLLGRLLLLDGDAAGAERALSAALAAGIDAPLLHNQLGDALDRLGRDADAVSEYRAALAAQPDLTSAANNLAWILASSPDTALSDPAAALRLAETAAAATARRDPQVLDTLAVALAANGRFDEAVESIDAALTLPGVANTEALAARRARFSAREAYVERAPAR